jgi:formate dehydrogenase major subunit/NADH-quinone oxidoreductase subunit G
MKTATITIDGRMLSAGPGDKVLQVALRHGIYIPNLCYLEATTTTPTACRLCFVEVEGKTQPVTACTEPATDGVVVNTKGQNALRLARSAFELLMASHPLACGTCVKNHRCELQRIARHLRVSIKPRNLRIIAPGYEVDSSHPLFTLDNAACVLCDRCVEVCRARGGGVLGYTYRGFNRRVVVSLDAPGGTTMCRDCMQCVSVCPVAALLPKSDVSLPVK